MVTQLWHAHRLAAKDGSVQGEEPNSGMIGAQLSFSVHLAAFQCCIHILVNHFTGPFSSLLTTWWAVVAHSARHEPAMHNLVHVYVPAIALLLKPVLIEGSQVLRALCHCRVQKK